MAGCNNKPITIGIAALAVKAAEIRYPLNRALDTVTGSKPDRQNGYVQHLRVVGEVKVPWHNIDMAFEEEDNLRRLLGQPIRYILRPKPETLSRARISQLTRTGRHTVNSVTWPFIPAWLNL
ncbi:hypothetical protein N7530_006367 [Penicillium desertorum]|uniref:Uncharacterized protein n=1 Tax=Penicillium desertorum TaxID=1303715 RepID=A0A9W9WRI4_9EURO|nr:hypothetical protein N7530_006367 [Penicillium desertorum]